MAAVKTERAIEPGRTALEAWFAEQGLSPHRWSNAPGAVYGRHDHGYHKVLICQEGSIVFHTDEGDLELLAGDRLDLPPGTGHAATVGPSGVTCVEAARG